MILDERFLKVHPRTALWWQEREQCAKCEHCTVAALTQSPSRGTGTNMGGQWSCSVATGSGVNKTCISAREEGRECGPDASLFAMRRAVA